MPDISRKELIIERTFERTYRVRRFSTYAALFEQMRGKSAMVSVAGNAAACYLNIRVSLCCSYGFEQQETCCRGTEVYMMNQFRRRSGRHKPGLGVITITAAVLLTYHH